MEQLNHVLPATEGEKQTIAVAVNERKSNSPRLSQMRQKFSIYGSISLIFGGAFALLFYKAGLGVNSLLFVIVMVTLLTITSNKLMVPTKNTTKAYYLGAILLGLSTMLTASEVLQLLNTVGILLLLEASLLLQFREDDRWDLLKHLGHMVWMVFQGIAAIGMPFIDSYYFFGRTKLIKNDKLKNIIVGILIALPMLWIIGALLSSADLLFGKMTKQINQALFSTNIIYIILMILFGFVACYCIIYAALSGSGTGDDQKTGKKADPTIAVTGMTMLFLVYVVFCGIQVIYLFSNGLFLLPKEFTFAQYARRGFFELLTVTVINIFLMLLCTTVFRESKVLRGILTGITICTYILIVSAAYRMFLYIGAYNLTFLRIFVLLFLFIDALILAGVIISEYRKKFPLFRYCVAVITVCYLIFSFAKPDYFIATYHIDHTDALEEGDIIFLTRELSYDAAPVVLPFLSENDHWAQTTDNKVFDGEYTWFTADDSIEDYYKGIAKDEMKRGIRDFNYSYYTAYQYAEQFPGK